MFSMSVIISLFFVVFIGVFGVMIWMDGKKTYILPPKLNYNDGNSESNGEQATADHLENKKTGEITAKASAGPDGKALATAELGYEYQHSGTQAIKLYIELTFSYLVNLKTDNDQSTLNGKVEALVNTKSKTIVDDSLTTSGNLSNPESGKSATKSNTLAVSLQPGEKFTAYLKFTAEAANTAEGNCTAQITGKLTEICYRSEINLM